MLSEFEGMNETCHGKEKALPIVAKKHPVIARATRLVSMVLFLVAAWRIVVLIAERGTDARNAPVVLLTSRYSTNALKLPELPSWKAVLSTQDLAFGQQQVAQMVRDRPEMARS